MDLGSGRGHWVALLLQAEMFQVEMLQRPWWLLLSAQLMRLPSGSPSNTSFLFKISPYYASSMGMKPTAVSAFHPTRKRVFCSWHEPELVCAVVIICQTKELVTQIPRNNLRDHGVVGLVVSGMSVAACRGPQTVGAWGKEAE